jgi:hypothetical protein
MRKSTAAIFDCPISKSDFILSPVYLTIDINKCKFMIILQQNPLCHL